MSLSASGNNAVIHIICRIDDSNARQQVKIHLPQTLNEALQIALAVLEAEAQEKEMKLCMPTRKSALVMMAQVVENLDNVSSRELMRTGSIEFQ
jgi:Mor family transcriptional regulator